MSTTSKWHPSRWKNEVQGTAWDLVKEAMRRDWEQTKHDLGIGGHDLNQAAADTVLQAGGGQAVPPRDVPNAPTAQVWDDVEPSFGFGYWAHREFGREHPRWDPEIECKLRAEWAAAQDKASRDWDAIVRHVRQAYDYEVEAESRRKRVTVNAKSTTGEKHVHQAEGGAAGAVAGATIGSVAGPPGAIVGGIIGGLVGAAAATVLDEKSGEQAERDRELDDEIGVTSGAIGAPNLKHPPERNVAYAAEVERQSIPNPKK